MKGWSGGDDKGKEKAAVLLQKRQKRWLFVVLMEVLLAFLPAIKIIKDGKIGRDTHNTENDEH